MLCGIVYFLFLIVKTILIWSKIGDFQAIGWCMLFAVMLATILIVTKDFKYIRIEDHTIKIFSLYHFSGKQYDLRNYIGTIGSSEYGSLGTYKTAYLVDKSMYTKVKINGLFYRNFDEMVDAIDLPQIKSYKSDFANYLRLLFTGRMKVEVKQKKKK